MSQETERKQGIFVIAAFDRMFARERKNQDGSEYGMCILPDGKEVEEWAYYRANNGGNGK